MGSERGISCRIVDIDYLLATPIREVDPCYSSFSSTAADCVPVIRIFDATPTGKKTCLHLHGTFPYLLVRYLIILYTVRDKIIKAQTRTI